MRKILVPMTLASESHAALPVAIHFARACNATVVLLHVVQRGLVDGGASAAWALPLTGSCLPAVEDGCQDRQFRPASLIDSYKELDKIAARIRPDAPVEIAVCTGLPAGQILEEAQRQKVEAIVMCTHGYKGWRKWLHRNTAQQVLRHATCPVWHISPGRNHQSITLRLTNQGSPGSLRKPARPLRFFLQIIFPRLKNAETGMVFNLVVKPSKTGYDRSNLGELLPALQPGQIRSCS